MAREKRGGTSAAVKSDETAAESSSLTPGGKYVLEFSQ